MRCFDNHSIQDEWVKSFFEKNGWNQDKAGADWDAAMTALEKCLTLRRGIIVSGEYGCGKTAFIRLAIRLYRICENKFPKEHKDKYSGITVRDEPIELNELLCFKQEEVAYLNPCDDYNNLSKFCGGHILIDDLGTEKFHNQYGEKYDLVGDFICRYHERSKGLMFITTNLHGEELAQRYDGRVVSRLKDLCVPLRFNGKDKRDWVL